MSCADLPIARQVEALKMACECMKRGEAIPSDVTATLTPGIDMFLAAVANGQSVSLDQSLGLKRHGGVPISRAVVNAERDQLIRHLAQSHPQWTGKPYSVIGREMSKEFDRYLAGRWKRERLAASAPIDEPFSTFWRLMQAGSRIPGAEQIRKILSLVIQDPV